VQGTTAGWVARWLGLRLRERTGWAIIGAGRLGRSIGWTLKEQGISVVLIDRNFAAVDAARAAGLVALAGDALDPALPDDPGLAEIGSLLCATENPALNRLLADRWAEVLTPESVHTWADLCIEADRGKGRGEMRATASVALPARVDQALASGELQIRCVDPEEEISAETRTLFYLHAGQASRTGPGLGRRASRVVLEWRPVTPLDLFQRIVLLRDARSARVIDLYAQLLEVAHSLEPRIDLARAEAALTAQADVRSVLLGNGVAIPHLITDDVDRPCCIVGVTLEAVPGIGSEDPLRIICLLLSPTRTPTEHLEALARVASWASEKARVSELIEAQTDGERLAVLNAYTPSEGPLARRVV